MSDSESVPTENLTAEAAAPASALVSLDHYLQALGRSRSTFWRWERQGLVSSVNVLGRKYIERQEIARFEAAALRGELAQERSVPSRPAAGGAGG